MNNEYLVLVSESMMKRLIAGSIRGQINDKMRLTDNYREAAIAVARDYLSKYNMDESRADCYTPNELAALIFEHDSEDIQLPNSWICKAMKDDHIRMSS